jgi:hypothetical protein
MSLDVIAGLAGISRTYLGKVELGVRSGYRQPVIARPAMALEVPPTEPILLALEDYLAHGEDREPGEGDCTPVGRAGRCRMCPVSLPGGATCTGECG